MKATLENLTKENLMKIVESEKKKDKRYDWRIISILNVLTIINHIKEVFKKLILSLENELMIVDKI